jgi:hypothetical protein
MQAVQQYYLHIQSQLNCWVSRWVGLRGRLRGRKSEGRAGSGKSEQEAPTPRRPAMTRSPAKSENERPNRERRVRRRNPSLEARNRVVGARVSTTLVDRKIVVWAIEASKK